MPFFLFSPSCFAFRRITALSSLPSFYLRSPLGCVLFVCRFLIMFHLYDCFLIYYIDFFAHCLFICVARDCVLLTLRFIPSFFLFFLFFLFFPLGPTRYRLVGYIVVFFCLLF